MFLIPGYTAGGVFGSIKSQPLFDFINFYSDPLNLPTNSAIGIDGWEVDDDMLTRKRYIYLKLRKCSACISFSIGSPTPNSFNCQAFSPAWDSSDKTSTKKGDVGRLYAEQTPNATITKSSPTATDAPTLVVFSSEAEVEDFIVFCMKFEQEEVGKEAPEPTKVPPIDKTDVQALLDSFTATWHQSGPALPSASRPTEDT